MKKKLLILSLLILCLCVLAGCECKHEWVEADCLTAKTCTKCEAVEGDPLGHDFAPATCQAPETCTRCGLTQGESLGHEFAPATCQAPETCSRCGEVRGETLPHTYSDWVLGDTDMTRACVNCGTQETTALDREVYLQQLLSGHWDLYGTTDNGQSYSVYNFKNDFLYYFSAASDGSAVLYNGKEASNFTSCTLEKYEEIDGTGTYSFVLTSEDGVQVYGYILDMENEDGLVFPTGESSQILLTKNRELAAAMEGTWAATANGQVCALTLNADRSFSGDLGGQVTGTWQLKPPYISYGYRTAYITLRYTRDGEAHTESLSVDLGYANTTLEAYLRQDGYLSFGISLDDDTYLNFTHMSQEDLALLEAAMAEGREKITGEWTSTEVSTWSYSSSTWDERSTTDYTITFAEDGTFTASLDQERSGTWEFQDAYVSGGTASYSYCLYFDGVSDSVYAHISTYDDAELSFGKSSQSSSTNISFEQPNPEKAAAEEAAMREGAAALAGTWNSLYVSEYDSNTGSSTYKNVLDYTITFAEDGTFTASMDGERTGTWEFDDWYVYDSGDGTEKNSYSFNLHFDGASGRTNIYVDNYSLSLGTNSKSVEFLKMSEEEWDALRKGLELPVGSWTAVNAGIWNSQTNAQQTLDTSGCTLTVNADFTCSGMIGTTAVSGTWCLTYYNSEEGYYSYTLSNGTSAHHGFSIGSDGALNYSIWDDATGTSTYYEMKRS